MSGKQETKHQAAQDREMGVPKIAASRNNLCLISQNGSINRLADLRLVSEAVEVLVASRHVLGQVVVESVPGRK